MPNAGHLFLSYSSRDRDKVRAVHRYLSERGVTTFFDQQNLRAGLVPKLQRRRPPHETWDVEVFTPGERPWFRLADALGPLRFPDKSDTELDIEIDTLASALHSGELSLAFLLDRILQRQGKLHRLLLVVDQFEELFTLTPARAASPSVSRCVAMSMWSTVWRSAPMARA